MLGKKQLFHKAHGSLHALKNAAARSESHRPDHCHDENRRGEHSIQNLPREGRREHAGQHVADLLRHPQLPLRRGLRRMASGRLPQAGTISVS